jgi:hypothetical protein
MIKSGMIKSLFKTRGTIWLTHHANILDDCQTIRAIAERGCVNFNPSWLLWTPS